jgi:CRP/FNR family cyclic AMP-dependent transcriptional regulator
LVWDLLCARMTAPRQDMSLAPPDSLREYFERFGDPLQFNPGDYLFWEGEPAHTFYCIDAGEVELQIFAGDLGFVPVRKLESGDCLGWSSLLPPYQWLLSARANSPCTVRACNAEALRHHGATDARFGYEINRFILKLIAARIRDTRRRLLEVC